jgi:hypothetical protein
MAAPEDFNTEPVAIKSSPLAPLPMEDVVTADQWRTLMAIADTVIPTVIEKSKEKTAFKELAIEPRDYSIAVATIDKHALRAEHKDLTIEYLNERPSQNPVFREAVRRFLALSTPKDLLKLMQLGLNLLQ